MEICPSPPARRKFSAITWTQRASSSLKPTNCGSRAFSSEPASRFPHWQRVEERVVGGEAASSRSCAGRRPRHGCWRRRRRGRPGVRSSCPRRLHRVPWSRRRRRQGDPRRVGRHEVRRLGLAVAGAGQGPCRAGCGRPARAPRRRARPSMRAPVRRSCSSSARRAELLDLRRRPLERVRQALASLAQTLIRAPNSPRRRPASPARRACVRARCAQGSARAGRRPWRATAPISRCGGGEVEHDRLRVSQLGHGRACCPDASAHGNSGALIRRAGAGFTYTTFHEYIRRAVPIVFTDDPAGTRAFYESFLGFSVGMDEDGFLMLVSPSEPTTQVIVCWDSPAARWTRRCSAWTSPAGRGRRRRPRRRARPRARHRLPADRRAVGRAPLLRARAERDRRQRRRHLADLRQRSGRGRRGAVTAGAAGGPSTRARRSGRCGPRRASRPRSAWTVVRVEVGGAEWPGASAERSGRGEARDRGRAGPRGRARRQRHRR